MSLYYNQLSKIELENGELQKAARNLQGEVKNLKSEHPTLKNTSNSRGSGAMIKDKGRPDFK